MSYRKSEADWDRDVLWRIVALLFAFAGLAELAGGCSYRRRRCALEVLLQAEATALGFVIGMVADAPEPIDPPELACDATRLAASFRALALALCVLLSQAWRFKADGAAAAFSLRQKSAASAALSGQAALPAPDTS